MSFTLNAGEFDLGAGFIGRGTILTGEAYALGTATTGVQGLLNTSGLEGICYSYSKQYQWYSKAIAWRASNDALTDDPYSGDVILLINGDAIVDRSPSPKAITTYGNTTIAQVAGYEGIYFDGNGDYLSIDSSAFTALSSGSYTWESWVYTPSSAAMRLFSGPNNAGVILRRDFIAYSPYTSGDVFYSDAALNSWYHLAFSSDGVKIRTFFNGIKQNEYNHKNMPSFSRLFIGSSGNSGYWEWFTGYLRDIRITANVCRYTANFIPFSNTISVPSEDSNANTATTWTGRGAPTVQPYTSQLPNEARFHSVIQIRSDSNQGTVLNGYLSHLNASTTNSKVVVSPSPGSQIYENLNNINLELFGDSLLWRFLARDHATALIHYPGTNEEGSVFAASCINSATQWGLWIAGEVGDRSAYFNQTQGYFAIVLLVDGANTYFSAFSPSAENSTTRNDSRMRAVNILPKPGQIGDDRFSELLLFRDQENGYSERLGTVPGLIYIDMNRVENAELVVGDKLTIEPGLGTTYNLTNKGALIVARWGRDISATISNIGSLFTVSTISSPTSASLAEGNRNRWILENNQRIRFTATPPGGVSAGVDYWIKNWDPIAFTFQIANTEGGATIVPGGDASSTIVRYAPLIAMPCYAA